MEQAKILYNGDIITCILKSKDKHPEDIINTSLAYKISDKSAEILYQFISKHNDNMTVLGDCDVDGLSSIAVVQKYFDQEWIDASYVISNRSNRGFTKKDVEFIIKKYPNTSGILTVDCGTNSLEAIEFAAKNNIEVFVTDHHNPSGTSPTDNIINPKLDQNAEFNEFCGASVIYLGLDAIYGKNNHAIQYAAIATIADVVPLIKDNRWIYNSGLALYNNQSARCPELYNFIKQSGLYLYDEKDIGWRIAPLINSGSRMNASDVAYAAYVLGDSESVVSLKDINKQRKIIVSDSIESSQHTKIVDDCAVSMIVENISAGLVGLIASRLCSEHNKQALVISTTPTKNNISAASLRGYACHDFLEYAKGLNLGNIAGGGHDGAAGLTFDILPEEFAKIYHDWYNKNYANYSYLIKKPSPDIEISLADAILTLPDKEKLKPFGNAFDDPIYYSKDVKIDYVGKTGSGYNKYAISDGEKVAVCYDYDNTLSKYNFDDGGAGNIVYTIEYNTFVRSAAVNIKAVEQNENTL